MKKILILVISFLLVGTQMVAAASLTVPQSKTTIPLNYTFNRELHLGSKGTEVKKLQNLLKDNGYYYDTVTGIFDENTSEAVKSFQLDNALPELGYTNVITNSFLTKISQRIGDCSRANGRELIHVINPNSEKTYIVGQVIHIRWASCNISHLNVSIELQHYEDKNEVANTGISVTDDSTNSGRYSWTVPTSLPVSCEAGTCYLPFDSNYKIAIFTNDGRVFDDSKDFFTLSTNTKECDMSTQSIKLISPNGGEILTGSTFPIKWSSCNVSSNTLVTIILTDVDSTGNTLSTSYLTANGLANTGNFDSITYNLDKSSHYHLMIALPVNGDFTKPSSTVFDTSDQEFTIN